MLSRTKKNAFRSSDKRIHTSQKCRNDTISSNDIFRKMKNIFLHSVFDWRPIANKHGSAGSSAKERLEPRNEIKWNESNDDGWMTKNGGPEVTLQQVNFVAAYQMKSKESEDVVKKTLAWFFMLKIFWSLSSRKWLTKNKLKKHNHFDKETKKEKER